jgi:hypothetical protein
MTLFVYLIYEDGTTTPKVEIPLEESDAAAEVKIHSIDNAVVARVAICDGSGTVISTSAADLYMRVVDSMTITILPPSMGWPESEMMIAFAKNLDEAKVTEMVEHLKDMAGRLKDRPQQQGVLAQGPLWSGWLTRGMSNVPTGDYL